MKDYITYLKFDDLTETEILDYYKENIINHKRTLTITPNLDILRITYKDKWLRDGLNSCDISTIDGKPIQWIAKFQKKKTFKHKISGSDLSLSVIEMANKNNFSLLIFGGKEGVADIAKEKLLVQYPNLRIETICPEFGYEKTEETSKKYINEINSMKCDIVLFCTGFPKTEQFFFKYKNLFAVAQYFFVGATVDFIAGTIKRAPKWMSNCGLEWMFRLFSDFKRLFKRYWFDFWFLIKLYLILIFNKNKIKKIIDGVD